MTKGYNVRDLEMLQDNVGAWYYKLDGKPYNGYVFAVSPKTNMLIYEGHMVNGYQDGIQRYFYQTGQLKSEENFVNNIQHGTCKAWHENGILSYECQCDMGVTIWSKSYNEQGEITKEYPEKSKA